MLKSLLLDIRLCVLCCFSHVQLFATLWTVDLQVPLSMGFSRQEYWSGSPCSPARNLPNPGIEPTSPALPADSLLLKHWGSPSPYIYHSFIYFSVYVEYVISIIYNMHMLNVWKKMSYYICLVHLRCYNENSSGENS